MITSVQLVDYARGLTSVIKPRAGVAWQGVDFSTAARADEEDNAQADGSTDTTSYLTSGALSFTVALPTGNRAVLDELAAFQFPSARPYLVVWDDGWTSPRQVQLRYDSAAKPITTGTGLVRTVQFSWKCPRGLWEDLDTLLYLLAADQLDTAGLAFTDTAGATATDAAGFTFPPSSSAGDTVVSVVGNARPVWRARMYGPAVGPALANDSTGDILAFTSQLVLGPGDYLELNSGPGPLAKSALLNGDINSSRLSMLDWPNSGWFPLDPGKNLVRYTAASGATPSTQCELTVWPVWLP